MRPRFAAPLLLILSLFAGLARAEWKEPSDRRFTEDQLKVYLDAQKDWLVESTKMLQDSTRATTDAEKVAAVADIDKRYEACLERHQISRAEFEWIGQRAMEAWSSVALVDKALKSEQEKLDAQGKENKQKLAEAQKRLAIYQAAQKSGARVMTDEDRDAAIKSAKNDRQAALDDAKQHGDDAAAAETEAKQHDAEAKSADELAKNPPSDVSADDRDGYIAGKKAEAQAARDAAKEARGGEADARKAQADAMATADAAGQRSAHPEIPLTDDEKASVKADDDEGVASALKDVQDCQQRKAAMANSEQVLQTAVAQSSKDVPEENLAIMRKYADRYGEQLGSALGGAATTRPG